VDQIVINVEGDKAAMEVPSPEAGVIKEVLVKVGDKVSTGTPMFVLESSDANVSAVETPKVEMTSTSQSAVSSVVEIYLPDIGGDEVNVTEIMVNVGDSVSEEQSLITVEGDKASMEVPAPFAGVVKEVLVKSGDKVSTASLIMRFEVAGGVVSAQPAATAPVSAAPILEAPIQTATPINQDIITASSFAHATP
ncbi:MAG TPA: dihydrolipoamide acetyltransferase, partial [Pasteurellaceae bacterium]|nr:dihydrolipoamide acetyltransferase [Pasteurellaceae bacterium]